MTSTDSIERKIYRFERKRILRSEVAKKAAKAELRRNYRKAWYSCPTKGILNIGNRPDETTVARLRADVPYDTRTVTGVLMGDPIPGDPRRRRG